MVQVLQKKALYNVLQINIKKCDKRNLTELKNDQWLIENYRKFPLDELLKQLAAMHLSLTDYTFEAYSKDFDTPEEMTEAFVKQYQIQEEDRLFLLVFEMWRRLCPEKRSPSIFGDELDYQIMLYLEESELSYNSLQDLLSSLQKMIEDNVDAGCSPKEAFEWIQTFCAHDLESFLYHFILDHIEEGNPSYAKELLEGFSPYFEQKEWFDYLKARANILEDPEEGFTDLENVIHSHKASPEKGFFLEILSFLSTTGNHSLFMETATIITPHLVNIEELKELCEMALAHYKYLNLEGASLELEDFLKRRATLSLSSQLSQADKTDFLRLLNQKHLSL